MAYNELFALAFVAPYVASEKKIPPETVQEMMRRSLYHIKWYFAKTDLNTAKGKAENKKSAEYWENNELYSVTYQGAGAVPHSLKSGQSLIRPLKSQCCHLQVSPPVLIDFQV